MSTDQIFDLSSLVIGVLLILVAIFVGSRIPSGKFSFTRGSFSFNIDPVPLLFVIGFLMACTGAFFRWEAHKGLQDKLDKTIQQVETLNDQLTNLRGQRLTGGLATQDVDPPNWDKVKVVETHITNPNGTPENKLVEVDSNGTFKPIDGLQPKSTVEFRLKDGNGRIEWQGDSAVDIAPQKVQVNMKRVRK